MKKITDETKASIVCAAVLGIFFGMLMSNHEKLAFEFIIGSFGILAVSALWDCHNKDLVDKRAKCRTRKLIEDSFISNMAQIEKEDKVKKE